MIENLPKDDAGNIDFMAPVLQQTGALATFATSTTARHNMRMDLVAQDLVNDQNMLGEIMLVNDMTNPFKVKENMAIVFATGDELKKISGKTGVEADENLKKLLVNKNKAQQVDESRTKYLSDKKKRDAAKNAMPTQVITDGKKAVETGPGYIKLNPIL